MVWYGMVWYGMVWYGMVWYGMVWYGMVWYGMVWYGMVWYGMVWYGMVWYGMALAPCSQSGFVLWPQGTYRDELVQKWRQDVVKYGIPASVNFSLQNTMASPAEVHEWRMQGLPTDTISVDNAIMVMRAQLWPMLIDPQMQANHWLKVMEVRSAFLPQTCT